MSRHVLSAVRAIDTSMIDHTHQPETHIWNELAALRSQVAEECRKKGFIPDGRARIRLIVEQTVIDPAEEEPVLVVHDD